MIHALHPPHYLKPYWSKQHGAYLTLITCWAIGVGLSLPGGVALPVQLSALVLLLSGLNLGELVLEKLKRKTHLPAAKQYWLYIYGLLTAASCMAVYQIYLLRYLLPFFLTGGALFILLSFYRLQKSIVAEWITFALFSFAGLLAYKPAATPDLKDILSLGLLMSLYFGISIFTVKARLNKVASFAALIYAAAASIVLYILFGFTPLTVSISLLLMLKSLPAAILKTRYGKMKIKQVGMLEMVFHVVFAALLILLYK